MRAVETLQDLGHQWGLGEQDLFRAALVLEETATNVVHHALQRNAQATFRVTIDFTGDALELELRDAGAPFDPTTVTPPERLPDEEASPGGWGLHRRSPIPARSWGECPAAQEVSRPDQERVRPDVSSNPITGELKPSTAMPLDVHIKKEAEASRPGTVTVTLTGSLDTATAPELERQLAPVLAEVIKDLVFDLAELKFISSAGLRVFSTARKTLKARGGQASFVNLQPQIREVFEIMKSLPGVAVFQDVAELDRYLVARQRSYEEPNPNA
jgi:anti-anti-sigma factor